MLLALIIALPFLGAVLPMVAARWGRTVCAISALVPTLASLGLLVGLRKAAHSPDTPRFFAEWLPHLGLNFSLRLDGLSYLFALLVLVIGALVVLYARYYLSEKEPIGRFYSYLLVFMGAMLGVVLSSNMILLVIFWELTSLSSFLLIGFWGYSSDARKGARMALTVTGAGGLALLAGVLLIGQHVGSFEFSDVLTAGERIRTAPLYPLMLILVLVGAFTKSAQFPFHFWLPHAMAAPTPVSAYLHSATMVKAGVFLLARFYPALSGTDWWFYIVGATGLATLLIGAVMAMFQHDLKGLLAYSTISHLGLITLLFGMDSPLSNVAALFHIINHATFKASLFMAAGIIDHETGSRDLRKLSGLRTYMPHTFLLATVACLSMAGVPLFNGFLSKEMFFGETLEQARLGEWGWIVPAVATIAAIFSVGYSVRFVAEVFFGPKAKALPIYPPHEAPRYMRLPIEVLVIVCVVVGVFPAATVASLLSSASYASLGGFLPNYSLAIWHGWNLPVLMSVMAMVGGLVIYRYSAVLFPWSPRLESWDANRLFERVIQMLGRAAQAVTTRLENRSFRRYAGLTLGMACVAVLWPLSSLGSWTGPREQAPFEPVTALCMVFLALSAVLTVHQHRVRLRALLIMGVAGLMVALLFARYSAPDLALTQISIEVATLVLLMLALYFLPSFSPVDPEPKNRVVRGVIAGAVGVMVSALSYVMLTRPYETLADFYVANSVSGGGGTNIVNVILVDFRGYDTMGEITVLTLAALGIVALLSNLQLFKPTCDPQGHNWAKARHPLVFETLSRVSLPFALIVAAYIFMRGHNEPGGGFIAGLITASALILQYIASGTRWVEARFPVRYQVVAGCGVAIAGLTGLGSLVVGAPFLTSAFGHWTIPWIGEIEIASALLFDLGVYLAVVGASMLILTSLGKLNLVGEKEESS